MSRSVMISEEHAALLDELEHRTGVRRYKVLELILDALLRDGADGFAARLARVEPAPERPDALMIGGQAYGSGALFGGKASEEAAE